VLKKKKKHTAPIYSFFKGILGTQFGSLEFQIGSLESQKIIIGSLKSDKIGSLESEKNLQIHIGYLTFSLKTPCYIVCVTA